MERSCIGCTACCDGWVKITVKGYEAKPGQPCPYSTGSGCKDYQNRPEDPCRKFNCGWVMPHSPLPEWMKPSEARVLVVLNKMLFQGNPVDLAVPTGKRIPQRSLEWLKAFASSKGRPLMIFENIKENGRYTGESELTVFGPENFRLYAIERIQMGKTVW